MKYKKNPNKKKIVTSSQHTLFHSYKYFKKRLSSLLSVFVLPHYFVLALQQIV